jgi:hypothetical protein
MHGALALLKWRSAGDARRSKRALEGLDVAAVLGGQNCPRCISGLAFDGQVVAMGMRAWPRGRRSLSSSRLCQV